MTSNPHKSEVENLIQNASTILGTMGADDQKALTWLGDNKDFMAYRKKEKRQQPSLFVNSDGRFCVRVPHVGLQGKTAALELLKSVKAIILDQKEDDEQKILRNLAAPEFVNDMKDLLRCSTWGQV